MASSWEVRLAAALCGVGVLLGGGLVLASLRLFSTDPGFLFAIMPVIATAAFLAGTFIAMFSLALVLSLLHATSTARLRTAIAGVSFVGVGLAALSFAPWLGFALCVYGGLLLWLMLMPGAERDLGPWTRGLKQPAPWGSTPGTALWSDAPPQQGPWSPDPTTLPWMPWPKQTAGPRTPWWEVWEAGLRQGVPLWELLLLGGALLVFAAGLLGILAGAEALGLLGVAVAFGCVVPIEKRMRERAAGRR